MQIEVRDSPDAGRYEVSVDGSPAGMLVYDLDGDRITMFHAEVDPVYGGQGVGSQLARHALDDARARGLVVVPACPFVSDYLSKHPEYADLVPADVRERLDLS